MNENTETMGSDILLKAVESLRETVREWGEKYDGPFFALLKVVAFPEVGYSLPRGVSKQLARKLTGQVLLSAYFATRAEGGVTMPLPGEDDMSATLARGMALVRRPWSIPDELLEPLRRDADLKTPVGELARLAIQVPLWCRLQQLERENNAFRQVFSGLADVAHEFNAKGLRFGADLKSDCGQWEEFLASFDAGKPSIDDVREALKGLDLVEVDPFERESGA